MTKTQKDFSTGFWNIANRKLCDQQKLDFSKKNKNVYTFYPQMLVLHQLDLTHYIITHMTQCLQSERAKKSNALYKKR